MKLTMRRTLRGLEPLDPAGLRHVKAGEVVECEVVKPRSNKRNAWFWAYIATVHENLSDALAAKYPRPENLVQAMKVLTGWADTFWLPDGREVIQPRSIAFHNMDETEFAGFCERCVELANLYLIPGIDRDALRREIAERT